MAKGAQKELQRKSCQGYKLRKMNLQMIDNSFSFTSYKKGLGILIFYGIFFFSCEKKVETPVVDWENHQPFKAEYAVLNLDPATLFAQKVNEVNTVDLSEVSGLAESQVNQGGLWAHNDSGNGNILYLIDKNTGKIKGSYRINGAESIDWEDMEVGPGPQPGINYIYMGDIGDNTAKRPYSTIYRFEEPVFEESHEGKFMELDINVDALNFMYPDGARDAETLLLDHNSSDLYIISKREFPARVYVYPFPQDAKNTTSLFLAGTLPFFAPVGGNAGPNGDEILVKTYDKIFYWQHNKNVPLWETLAKAPEIAPYDPVEPQGEAICFDSEGNYFTLSEKTEEGDVVLYKYVRNK